MHALHAVTSKYMLTYVLEWSITHTVIAVGLFRNEIALLSPCYCIYTLHHNACIIWSFLLHAYRAFKKAFETGWKQIFKSWVCFRNSMQCRHQFMLCKYNHTHMYNTVNVMIDYIMHVLCWFATLFCCFSTYSCSKHQEYPSYCCH